MIKDTLIEICIGNVEDAIHAAGYPIDRIELNSALELGGLSPSLETLKYLKEKITIPLCVMTRPRGGDFNYDQSETAIMYKDAQSFLENKADAIVFGFLKADKTIDIEKTSTMVKLIHAYGKQAVFHKAFDETPDLEQSAKILASLQVDRILTSGARLRSDKQAA